MRYGKGGEGEKREGKAGEGKGRGERGRDGKEGQGRGPPIFYCTHSSSFLEYA